MSTERTITCHCGQQVLEKDILQRRRFPRLLSSGFIYVKFRCSRCKRLGERFIPREDSIEAHAAKPEVSFDEMVRFEAMGCIDLDEVMDFHYRLQDAPLPDRLPR